MLKTNDGLLTLTITIVQIHSKERSGKCKNVPQFTLRFVPLSLDNVVVFSQQVALVVEYSRHMLISYARYDVITVGLSPYQFTDGSLLCSHYEFGHMQGDAQ